MKPMLLIYFTSLLELRVLYQQFLLHLLALCSPGTFNEHIILVARHPQLENEASHHLWIPKGSGIHLHYFWTLDLICGSIPPIFISFTACV